MNHQNNKSRLLFCKTKVNEKCKENKSQLLFKASFGDDLRRVTRSMIPNANSFASIENSMKNIFSLSQIPKLSYQDEDGDEIVIGSMIELSDAQRTQSPLRLKVSVGAPVVNSKSEKKLISEKKKISEISEVSEKIASTPKTTCSQGHDLIMSNHSAGNYSSGWVCDCCSHRGKKGEQRMFCLQCGFDVCDKCVADNVPQQQRFARIHDMKRNARRHNAAAAKKCPQQHELKQTDHSVGGYRAGFQCDECNTHSNEPRLACLTCQYDVCTSCTEKDQVHHGVTCDGCNVGPIVGPRHKCALCRNFDFCDTCLRGEAGAKHKAEHDKDIFRKIQPRGARGGFFGNHLARKFNKFNQHHLCGGKGGKAGRRMAFQAVAAPAVVAAAAPAVVAAAPLVPKYTMACLPSDVCDALLRGADQGSFIVSRATNAPTKIRCSVKLQDRVVHHLFSSVDEIKTIAPIMKKSIFA